MVLFDHEVYTHNSIEFIVASFNLHIRKALHVIPQSNSFGKLHFTSPKNTHFTNIIQEGFHNVQLL